MFPIPPIVTPQYGARGAEEGSVKKIQPTTFIQTVTFFSTLKTVVADTLHARPI